jgi:hypothetical protein
LGLLVGEPIEFKGFDLKKENIFKGRKFKKF